MKFNFDLLIAQLCNNNRVHFLNKMYKFLFNGDGLTEKYNFMFL